MVGIEATDESISDTKEFKNLVGQSVENVEDKGGEVVQASADGAWRRKFNCATQQRKPKVFKLQHLKHKEGLMIPPAA